MTFLWAVIIGLILGVLSVLLARRRSPGLVVVRAILGIVGGAIGGIVAMLFAPPNDTLRISIAGVIVLLVLWFFVSRTAAKDKKSLGQ